MTPEAGRPHAQEAPAAAATRTHPELAGAGLAAAGDRLGLQRARGGLAGWQIRKVEQLAKGDLSGLSAAVLAREVRRSPFHFCRAFKQSMGISPGRWLTRVRVDRARAMLTDSDQTVAEIARAVGYSGAAQLTRAFRNQVGAAPGEFRRR